MTILLTTNTDAHCYLHSSIYLQIFQTFIANNTLLEGKFLHSLINYIKLKFDPSTHKFMQKRLIHMYVNYESLVDTSEVFDCMIK